MLRAARCLPEDRVRAIEGAKAATYEAVMLSIRRDCGDGSGASTPEATLSYVLQALKALAVCKLAPSDEQRLEAVRYLSGRLLPAIDHPLLLRDAVIRLTALLLTEMGPDTALRRSYRPRPEPFFELIDRLFVKKHADPTDEESSMLGPMAKLMGCVSEFWEDPESACSSLLSRYLSYARTRHNCAFLVMLEGLPLRHIAQEQVEQILDRLWRLVQRGIFMPSFIIRLLMAECSALEDPAVPTPCASLYSHRDVIYYRLQCFVPLEAGRVVVAQICGLLAVLEHAKEGSMKYLEYKLQRGADFPQWLAMQSIQVEAQHQKRLGVMSDTSDVLDSDEEDEDVDADHHAGVQGSFVRSYAQLALPACHALLLTSPLQGAQTMQRLLRLDPTTLPGFIAIIKEVIASGKFSCDVISVCLRMMSPFATVVGSPEERVWLRAEVLRLVDMANSEVTLQSSLHAVEQICSLEALAGEEALAWGVSVFEKLLELCSMNIGTCNDIASKILFNLGQAEAQKCCDMVSDIIDNRHHEEEKVVDAYAGIAGKCADRNPKWAMGHIQRLVERVRREVAAPIATLRWPVAFLDAMLFEGSGSFPGLEDIRAAEECIELGNSILTHDAEDIPRSCLGGELLITAANTLDTHWRKTYMTHDVGPGSSPICPAGECGIVWAQSTDAAAAAAGTALVAACNTHLGGLVERMKSQGSVGGADALACYHYVAAFRDVLHSLRGSSCMLSDALGRLVFPHQVDVSGVTVSRDDVVELLLRVSAPAKEQDSANGAASSQPKKRARLSSSAAPTSQDPSTPPPTRPDSPSFAAADQHKMRIAFIVYQFVAQYFGRSENAAEKRINAFARGLVPGGSCIRVVALGQALPYECRLRYMLGPLVPRTSNEVRLVRSLASMACGGGALDQTRDTAFEVLTKLLQRGYLYDITPVVEECLSVARAAPTEKQVLLASLALLGDASVVLRLWSFRTLLAPLLRFWIAVVAADEEVDEQLTGFLCDFFWNPMQSQTLAEDVGPELLDITLQCPHKERAAIVMSGMLRRTNNPERHAAVPVKVVVHLLRMFCSDIPSVRNASTAALLSAFFLKRSSMHEIRSDILEVCTLQWLRSCMTLHREEGDSADFSMKARVWKALFLALGDTLVDVARDAYLNVSRENHINVFEMVAGLLKAQKHAPSSDHIAFALHLLQQGKELGEQEVTEVLGTAVSFGAGGVRGEHPTALDSFVHSYMEKCRGAQAHISMLLVSTTYLRGLSRRVDSHLSAAVDLLRRVTSQRRLLDNEACRQRCGEFISQCFAFTLGSHVDAEVYDVLNGGIFSELTLETSEVLLHVSRGSRQYMMALAPLVPKIFEATALVATERSGYSEGSAELSADLVRCGASALIASPEHLLQLLTSFNAIPRETWHLRKVRTLLDHLLRGTGTVMGYCQLGKPDVVAALDAIVAKVMSESQKTPAALQTASLVAVALSAVHRPNKAEQLQRFLEQSRSDSGALRRSATLCLKSIADSEYPLASEHTWGALRGLSEMLADADVEVRQSAESAIHAWSGMLREDPALAAHLQPVIVAEGLKPAIDSASHASHVFS